MVVYLLFYSLIIIYSKYNFAYLDVLLILLLHRVFGFMHCIKNVVTGNNLQRLENSQINSLKFVTSMCCRDILSPLGWIHEEGD